MSNYLSVIGGALLLLWSGCNRAASESTPLATDDQSLMHQRHGELTYFIGVDTREPRFIQVAAVNQTLTRCVDGDLRPFCPVDLIDFSESGLSDETAADFEQSFLDGKGVILGWMELGFASHPEQLVDKLYVVEAWVDPTPGPLTALVYGVQPVDLWCVRAPCPRYHAGVLNAVDDTLLHEIDLYAADADEDVVEQGYAQLAHDHILVGGVIDEYMGDRDDHRHPPEPLPGTRTLTSDTFYLRVVDDR